MNSASGSRPSCVFWAKSFAPFRQIHMSVNNPLPTSSGNQPPSGILSAFAPRKIKSMRKNGATTSPATTGDQRQTFHATMKSSVAVITMSPVTVMP